MRTSSEQATRDILEYLYNRVATMCSDPLMKVTPEEMRPMSWHKFLGVASQAPQRSLKEAKGLWQGEKMEVVDAKNISPEKLLLWKSFSAFQRRLLKSKSTVKQENLPLKN